MNSQIPIGIVGLNFGRHIIDQLLHDPASPLRLAAVCDLDDEKVACFSQAHGVPGYRDLDTLLADASIPAVGLFTGPVGRAALLEKIIDAGKDVVTTKPFELDCRAALAVLRKARQVGRIVHLNSPGPLLSPDLALVNQWRRQYDLGQPVGCHTSAYACYDEQADGSWYDDPSLCPVAPIFRLAIYLINDLVRLIGPAEAVSVVANRLNTGRPTPDNALLSIRFGCGALASLYASFCIADGDHYRNSMELHFERGTIYRNVGPDRQTDNGHSPTEMALVMGSGDTRRTVVARQVVAVASGAYQWSAFADAVRSGDRPDATSPETIVAGLRVIEAMARAETDGRVVAVEPVE